MALDVEQLAGALQANGLYAERIPGYIYRKEQVELLRVIADCFNSQTIALVEAGTGIGKTLSYLIPALLFAYHQKKCVVISTYTHTLQEQLVNKDIPNLLKALDIEMQVTLVKGMQNYVCQRRLEQELERGAALDPEERDLLKTISTWNHESGGDFASLPFSCSKQIWNKVSVEADLCTKRSCPHYQTCSFIKERSKARDASLCVVNHALFLSDRLAKYETGDETAILPDSHHVILDEGHQFDTVASDLLAARFSFYHLDKYLRRLHSSQDGCLEKLRQAFSLKKWGEQSDLKEDLLKCIDNVISDHYLSLLMEMDEGLSVLESMMKNHPQEGRIRLTQSMREEGTWKNKVVPALRTFSHALMAYCETLRRLSQLCDSIQKESISKKLADTFSFFNILRKNILKFSPIVTNFTNPEGQEGAVYWIERQIYHGQNHYILTEAVVDIADLIAKVCLDKQQMVVFLSATLTAANSFSYLKRRLGIDHLALEKRKKIEKQFTSPFNYKKQALFIVPTDMPLPNAIDFDEKVIEKIFTTVSASDGGTFVLFTSMRQLTVCYTALKDRLSSKYHLLCQGNAHRSEILHSFKASEKRAILFATSTFWQGVDVPGKDLQLVILVKLPFQVPNDPMMEARSEVLQLQGINPFFYDQLPLALMQFHQGFGRLVRHENDKGCVVCFDARLYQKGYGKLFLKSLPDCEKLFLSKEEYALKIKEFYQPSCVKT